MSDKRKRKTPNRSIGKVVVVITAKIERERGNRKGIVNGTETVILLVDMHGTAGY
jgi:hypothetical protein